MKIAILEDDPSQAKAIAEILESAGHACAVFGAGQALVARLRQDSFDLLILDWNLPDMSGLDVLAWLRRAGETAPPSLILTSRSTEADIVEGLNAGADDYVIKPADPAVLLARVNAILRRARPPEPVGRPERIGGALFDPLKEEVTLNGGAVPLTAKEYALALCLFHNLNRALSRAHLLQSIWGHHPDLPTRTLDAHVSRLRLKLGLRPENGFRLATVYSYGYRLETIGETPAPTE